MAKLTRVSTTARRLHEAMNMAHKRQADLVAETGLNKSTISRYCSGDAEPKAVAISKLAAALDVSEMWLWGYDVQMERTDGQKKNDQLVKLVVRMRSDSDFAKAVSMLDNLSPAQFSAILGMLSTMNQ